MAVEAKLTGRRRGAVMALGLVAIAAIAAVAIVAEYKEHTGAGAVEATPGMELRGVWLGLWVAGTNTPSARRFGIPEAVKGVVVTDLGQGPDARAAALGIVPGDVLARVDGREVGSLEQLYSMSGALDTTRPVQLDLLRQGQPFSVMLPAAADPAVRAAAWTPGPPQAPAGAGWGYGPGNNPNCPRAGAWAGQ